MRGQAAGDGGRRRVRSGLGRRGGANELDSNDIANLARAHHDYETGQPTRGYRLFFYRLQRLRTFRFFVLLIVVASAYFLANELLVRDGGKITLMSYGSLRAEVLPPSGRRTFDIQLECPPSAEAVAAAARRASAPSLIRAGGAAALRSLHCSAATRCPSAWK